MQTLINATYPWFDRLMSSYLGFHIPIWVWSVILVTAVGFGIATFFVAPLAGFTVYVERRVAGKMQNRIGPNRVGPEGLLQFIADGLKLLLKEDIVPARSDKFLFKIAPYLVFVGVFLCFVALPFGPGLVVADLNIGLFYILAVTSLVVIGILLAGWSSHNKWSLFGSLRSGAQMVSYEIPIGIILLIPVLWAGTMNLSGIVESQAGGIIGWNLFRGFGLGLLAFAVYFTAALAEGNRTPFDLPEAESELVAGYATEYSGIRFAVFFLAEYANMIAIGMLAAVLFLGGWNKSYSDVFFGGVVAYYLLITAFKSLSYFVKLLRRLVLPGSKHLAVLFNEVGSTDLSIVRHMILLCIGLAVAAFLYVVFGDLRVVRTFFFLCKSYAIVFVIIWLRWTLPRFRVDQMMSLCWKVLIPVSMVLVVAVAFVMAV